MLKPKNKNKTEAILYNKFNKDRNSLHQKGYVFFKNCQALRQKWNQRV